LQGKREGNRVYVVCAWHRIGDLKNGGMLNADNSISFGSFYVNKVGANDCRHSSDCVGYRSEEESTEIMVVFFLYKFLERWWKQ